MRLGFFFWETFASGHANVQKKSGTTWLRSSLYSNSPITIPLTSSANLTSYEF